MKNKISAGLDDSSYAINVFYLQKKNDQNNSWDWK
jgi:hypothetical protein